jgi:hypothetical protein
LMNATSACSTRTPGHFGRCPLTRELTATP